jgi:protein O-GlcNAc transferase
VAELVRVANVTIQQAMQIAAEHHQAGRLAEAEKIYRQVLSQQPRNAGALHLLGVIALQVGRPDTAIELIRQAIALNAVVAEFHNNLGNALRDRQLLDEAIAAYRQALRLKPDLAVAHYNLGNALRDQGLLDEAIAAYRQGLRVKPDDAVTHLNLGNVLRDKGLLDEAIAAYRHFIRLKPDYAEAYNNLGVVLSNKGLHDEAIAACRHSLRLKPDYAEAYNNLGNALRENGLPDEAIAALHDALRLKPDFAIAHNNLGNALSDKGLLDEAIAACREALRFRPDYAQAYNNLGNALRDRGLFDEAIAACRQAIRLKPDYAEAHMNLGVALRDSGRFDEAAAACCQSLRLKPDLAEAHNNLGSILKDQGNLDESLACFDRAVALSPRNPQLLSNRVYTLHFHSDYGPPAILREAMRWDDVHGKPLRSFVKPHANDRDPNRTLRIGYVSPDFREHPVGRHILTLLAAHDPARIEVFCYADVICPDAITQRTRGCAHQWRNVFGRSNAQLAETIQADGIDILVDLTMHMARGRPLLFARKPAPVQIAWLAYPGTTGLSAIDYRLTDPYLDPPGQNDAHYSEESVRLPDSFWCYDPLGSEPKVNRLPAPENGYITFGCLNNYCKVNKHVLALWAKVLARLHNSQLLLLAPEGHARQRALDTLASLGVDQRRIQFAPFQPRPQYLQTYHRIDIGLDTFPYNGHTTSLDSYWMGIPVVTLVGQTVAGRAGWSQLSNLGLQELAAMTPEQFIEIAVNLAKDLPRLSQLRTTLRERLQKSPLMDAPRFARNMEAAYGQMWRDWCASDSSR